MKFAALILTIILYVCANAQTVNHLSDSKWSLIMITNLKDNQYRFADSECGTTLNFDNKGNYSGFSGWNHYSGKYSSSENNRVEIDIAAQTLMAGPPNCELGETICQHFPQIKSFLIISDTLILFTRDSMKIIYKKIK